MSVGGRKLWTPFLLCGGSSRQDTENLLSRATSFSTSKTLHHLMGVPYRRLLMIALVLFALTLGTFVTGQRAHSWFRNPEDYDFRDHWFRQFGTFVTGQRAHSWFRSPEDYDFRDHGFRQFGDFLQRDPVELLNCSERGEHMKCVPLDLCPQSRHGPKRQFCRWTPNNDDSIPFGGPGVCCQNNRPNRQNKPPRAATSPPTKGNKNAESLTPKPSSQPINGVSSKPDFELDTRSGIDTNNACGLLEKDEKIGTRIIGGFDRQLILGAAIGGISLPSASESPWTAVVGEHSKDGSVDWFCGGSLLSQSTVLTAAHCARRRRPELVRVGEVDLRRNTKLGEGKGEEVKVKQVIMHPDYRPPSFYNDIAILILERPVDIRRPGGARTICLPPALNSRSSEETTIYNGKEAILTGWGHLSFGGDRSPILQEVRVTVFSNEECSRSYASPAAANVAKRSYPSGIINSQLCAGDRHGKKDACQGDSGGPLVMKGKDGKYSLIGVVSSGIGCGSKQYPGVYVRVSSYIDWIFNNMKF